MQTNGPMKFYYTYKITFIDLCYYYGKRECEVTPEDDIYWGSPTTHKEKWKTTMFFKDIISVYSSCDECSEAEIQLIKPVYKTDPLCLNEACGRAAKLSPEVIRKISEANKGRTHSEEAKEKMAMNHRGTKGYKHTSISKAKMSESKMGENHNFYGKTHSQETKQKMSEAKKGKPNGNKGKVWITNGTHSTLIEKIDPIPAGYRKGRVTNRPE